MHDFFPLSPASSKLFWVMLGTAAFLLVLGVGFLWVAVASRQIGFEISADGLRLSGDLWGRTIPSRKLKVDEARRVNLANESDLQPKWRSMGSAIGNYRAGWFKLRGGGKGLLYLTDPSNAILIPTTGDYVILLSVAEPDRFLARLREVCKN